MRLSDYLIAQFTEYVTVYKKYFRRTSGATMSLTVIFFVCIAVLLKFTNFDETSKQNQVSIANYLFYRNSTFNTYSITDLSKTLFVFFVSVFSVGFSRLRANDIDNTELSFFKCIRRINIADLFFLSLILIISAFLDYGFYSLNNYSFTTLNNSSAVKYVSSTLFQLKIYVPLFLFSLAITSLTGERKSKLTFKRIIFLFISLWIINEFAYELFVWTKNHLFNLLLIPVETPERAYVLESFMSIPLIGIFFLGYHSAMTSSLKLTEKNITVKE